MHFLALLLVATLFGGMLIYSFGFAPLVFNTLEPAVAGRMIRSAFPWYYLFVAVAAGLAAVALFWFQRRPAELMLAIAAAALYARQVLMPQINAARAVESTSSVGAHSRFARLHAFSVLINFLQLLAAGYVLHYFV